MEVNIQKIAGTDKRLYELVAPLVMNPIIIRYNNNYPFKTSAKYFWFVASRAEAVCGFIPVKVIDEQVLIDNYYIYSDDELLLLNLLREILKEYGSTKKYMAVVHLRHKEVFIKAGFKQRVEWKKYVKMDKL